MTANCMEVVSADNQASNGVVHVVDGVLEPAEETLSDMIRSRPELSTLKTCKSRNVSEYTDHYRLEETYPPIKFIVLKKDAKDL